MLLFMKQRKRQPRERTTFGSRLYAARLRAGLTQAELGERIGMSQRGVANWEIREHSCPNAEQLAMLADILDISVEELVRGSAEKIRTKPGPKGKLVRVFDQVADLPRTQQKDIVEIVEMLVKTKRKQLAGTTEQKTEP